MSVHTYVANTTIPGSKMKFAMKVLASIVIPAIPTHNRSPIEPT